MLKKTETYSNDEETCDEETKVPTKRTNRDSVGANPGQESEKEDVPRHFLEEIHASRSTTRKESSDWV